MIAGIVCEYNPFHKGHQYHIQKTREKADGIVCVMSGNFVQRGDCAFADKHTRAEIAVRCGADVVIDLPVPWACAPAGTFARGAVGLLGAFGVNTLSFGCETDDVALLRQCADFTVSDTAKKLAYRYMSQGMSYPAALSRAAENYLSSEATKIIAQPNSTLACEYIKAAENLGLSLDFTPVKRQGTDHDSDSISDGFASASKIRNIGITNSVELLPEVSFNLLKKSVDEGRAPCRLSNNERGILSSLRDIPFEEYSLYIGDESGIRSRIYDAVRQAKSLEELYAMAKTKSCTHANIRREVMSLYLKIPYEMREGIPPYLRILAVSEKGLTLLSQAKKKATLPIVTKHSEMAALQEKARSVYALQCSSTDKFSLLSPQVTVCGKEETSSVIILHNK